MRITQCDACKKLTKEESYVISIKSYSKLGRLLGSREYDACEECYKKLQEFFQ